jgi:ubiquinone/menaquinone biosynthesis C-methylase UbiE
VQLAIDSKRPSYDDIADQYDEHWSIHVREPQQRLTRELALSPGLRCADLGCGTGLDTVDMLRAVAPGEVVAVDCSRQMLDAARAHARAADLTLTTHCADAGAFILEAEPASFDVVTLRFCLGYLDWREMLPRLPRLVKAGGKLGMLTILANSAPQAFAAYEEMARRFGVPLVARSGAHTVEDIHAGLLAGGAEVLTSWRHSFRLQFTNGEQVTRFLRATGLASHPLLDQLAPSAAEHLWRHFAGVLDEQHGPGVPLDFHLAGLTATGRV